MKELIYGFLTSQYFFAVIYLVLDIRSVLKTRVYHGHQMMAAIVAWIPFLPFFMLIHIALYKAEKKILPKIWVFPPKSQKM